MLLTALLLFANLLVTTHAFGDTTHSPTETCSLLHHFERSTGASDGQACASLVDRGRLPPVADFLALVSLDLSRAYLSRAPPAIS